MNFKSSLRFVLVPVFALALGANADARKVDATKLTCAEFSSQTPEDQESITAFLHGYSRRSSRAARRS